MHSYTFFAILHVSYVSLSIFLVLFALDTQSQVSFVHSVPSLFLTFFREKIFRNLSLAFINFFYFVHSSFLSNFYPPFFLPTYGATLNHTSHLSPLRMRGRDTEDVLCPPGGLQGVPHQYNANIRHTQGVG